MTAHEFFDWVHRPENRGRFFELERGEVIEMSRPGERHGLVCANVVLLLGGYVHQRRQGYVCSNGTGLILEQEPDTVRGPDVLLYAAPRRYDDLQIRYSTEMPTLIVEVLSPNDRWPSVTRRVAQFLEHGVAVVWLVDPESQTLMVHRRNQLPLVLVGTEEFIGDDPLTGLRFPAADLFYLPGEGNPVTSQPPG